MATQPQKRGATAPAPARAAGVNNLDAGGIFIDQQDATDLAPRDFAEGDATGFLDNVAATFDSTMRSGLMVSKYRSKSIAYEPIMAAINKDAEGSQELTNPWAGASRGGGEGRIRPRAGVLGIDFSGGWAGVTPQEQERAVWAEIGRRRQRDPGFLPGIPRTREELDKKIDEDDRQALEADDDVSRRATLWGSAGGFVGGVGASFRDPINLLSLPLGAGGAKTILGAALREGGINAALTGVAQPAIARRSNELGRAYGLDDAVKSTLYGGIGGLVLGGGSKGLEQGARILGDRIGRARVSNELSQDKVMRFVMHRLEGGSAVVNYTDADGGVTKWGIAKKYNPDVDVANLTEQGALDISRRRYWTKELDKLDPRVAAVAYDAGFIGGAKARSRVAEAGKAGDWRAAIGVYRSILETRAQRPGKEKYATGWQKRIDRLEGFVDSAGGPRARSRPDGTYPPATHDEVSAAITLEGLDELGRTSPLPASPANDTRHIETLQAHIDAVEAGEPRPQIGEPVERIELRRPEAVNLDRYDPRELVIDPARFQFKAGGDDAGVLDTLRGVKEWNPILSGKAVVWVDEAGKPHVADGHQRVGLASRLIGENPAADIRIDAVTLREADGVSAEMARTWAALKNVAEGSGSPVDAAKVLRATGDSTPIPLPPRSALVRDARSLAALSDDAFGMVVNEIVPPSYAALVGRLAPAAPELHAAYLQLLHRLEPATITQADSIVRQAMAAGATRETQLGLFGEEIVSRSLYLERARVLDNSLRRLKNDKRIFRTLIDAQDDIEGAGNVLSPDANAAKVENNARALEILTRLAHRTGPVSDALGRAASELAGGRSAKSAVDQFVAELGELDLSELARGVERSARDGDVTGGLGRADGAGEPASGMDGQPAGGDAGAGTGGADNGLGEQIGTDLFGNPVYAERAAELEELDGAAALDHAADEAQAGFQLEGFSDVHAGGAAARQTELLEHDVRADAKAASARVEADTTSGGVLAYHGSGAVFDRFESGREGTLEFGHGHYFTDSADEAGRYREISATRMGLNPNEGKVYEVRLNPDKFLEWSKPLGEQSEHVQAAMRADEGVFKAIAKNNDIEVTPELVARIEGSDIYGELASILGSQKAASEKLSALGIHGMRYVEGGTTKHVVYDAVNLRPAKPGHDGVPAVTGVTPQPAETVTTIGRNELTDPGAGGVREFDMGEAGRRLREAADSALDRGATVTLHIDGKDIPIVARGMVDAEGARWGAMPIVSPEAGKRAELVIRERAAEAAPAEPRADNSLGIGGMGERVDPAIAERAKERAGLEAAAPLRSPLEQADVDGLGLFDTVRSPDMFAVADRLDDGRAVPELRTADDLLAELDADDAAIAAIERCLI